MITKREYLSGYSLFSCVKLLGGGFFKKSFASKWQIAVFFVVEKQTTGGKAVGNCKIANAYVRADVFY